MKRCAIGDYRCEDGVIISRPKQRTYHVLYGGIVAEFTGASVGIAQRGMVEYVAGLGVPP